MSILRVLNVAPTQLSPNSWSFIKAFELVCFGLDIYEPSVAVFFSFYHIKKLFPNYIVSLSAQPHRGLFGLYSSNYKNYKDTFMRVRCGEGGRDAMYSSDDTPLFPFYWTTNPRLIKGVVYETLSEFERDTVAFLESLNQMSPRDSSRPFSSVILVSYFVNLLALLHNLSLLFLVCSLLLLFYA
jgi:hypothetical protein